MCTFVLDSCIKKGLVKDKGKVKVLVVHYFVKVREHLGHGLRTPLLTYREKRKQTVVSHIVV